MERKYRYALRNQDKIAQYYGKETLKRMLDSLDSAFSNENQPKPETWGSKEPYQIIEVNDLGHSFGFIYFYVVRVKYDVMTLAFKEFIN